MKKMKTLEKIKWIIFKRKMQEKVRRKLNCEDPWTMEELEQMRKQEKLEIVFFNTKSSLSENNKGKIKEIYDGSNSRRTSLDKSNIPQSTEICQL